MTNAQKFKGVNMAKFKKCPRCDLNYIPVEEDYCSVCKEELRGIVKIDTDDEADIEEGLCPRCRENYVNEGEKYCEQCLREIEAEKDKSAHDDYWEDEEKVDDILEDDMIIDEDEFVSFGSLEDDEVFDEDEEEDVDYFEEDDFETVSADDYDEEEDEEAEEDDDEY